MDNVVVSVCCITYNHEKYIRETLEGFVSQKTDFPFEIIIHDDASTDKTREIIEEYKKTYPDIIKPIYQEENQYSKGVDPFYAYVFPAAKGKYFAMCEGDDYWTDPYKLQKQVDFLEANPDYGLVHTDAKGYIQAKNHTIESLNSRFKPYYDGDNKQELFYELLNSKYIIRTATVLFRKELLSQRKPNERSFKMGDLPLWLDSSQLTRFKYLDMPTAVYRISQGSASKSKSKLGAAEFEVSKYDLRVYYCEKYGYDVPLSVMSLYNKSYCFLLLETPHADIFYEPFPQGKFFKSCSLLKNSPYYRFFFILYQNSINFCFKVWRKILKILGLKSYSY